MSEILNRVLSVQFNQFAEDRLIKNGPKKQASTNRKRISHSGKAIQKKTYEYSKLLNREIRTMKVLETEKNCLKNIVRQVHLIWEKRLVELSREKERVVPSQNQFKCSLPVGYGPHKLLSIRSHKLLADMSSLEEEKLQNDILSEDDIGDKEKMFPQEFAIVTKQMI